MWSVLVMRKIINLSTNENLSMSDFNIVLAEAQKMRSAYLIPLCVNIFSSIKRFFQVDLRGSTNTDHRCNTHNIAAMLRWARQYDYSFVAIFWYNIKIKYVFSGIIDYDVINGGGFYKITASCLLTLFNNRLLSCPKNTSIWYWMRLYMTSRLKHRWTLPLA